MLTSMDSFDKSKNSLLDISTLQSGVYATNVIAYLQSFSTGVSRLEENYFTFFLKDKNGRVISARQFNVKDVVTTGFLASNFKGKLVYVNFMPQVFNGSLSLIVDDVRLCNEPIDTRMFIGVIEKSEDYLKVSNNILAKKGVKAEFPISISQEAFLGVYQGRYGGYSKFIYNVIKWMDSVCSNYRELDNKGLLITYHVLDLYKRYRQRKNTLDFVTIKEKLKLLNGAREIEDENVCNIVMDTMSALMDMSKPEHIYANLIYDCINNVLATDDMINLWTSVPGGVTRDIPTNKDKVYGRILTRY